MKFRCSNCTKEWVVPKEKFVYIRNWPNECPYCESVNISYVIAEKMILPSRILEDPNDEAFNKLRRKKLDIMCQDIKKGGVMTE